MTQYGVEEPREVVDLEDEQQQRDKSRKRCKR